VLTATFDVADVCVYLYTCKLTAEFQNTDKTGNAFYIKTSKHSNLHCISCLLIRKEIDSPGER
jgi:hypothetical protein